MRAQLHVLVDVVVRSRAYPALAVPSGLYICCLPSLPVNMDQSSDSAAVSIQEAAQLLMQAVGRLNASPAVSPAVQSSTRIIGQQPGPSGLSQSSHTAGGISGVPSRSRATEDGGHAQLGARYGHPNVHYPYRFSRRPRTTSRRRSSATCKAPKASVWKHMFVCLARVGQDTVPDATERVQLLQAGLGERQVCLDLGW